MVNFVSIFCSELQKLLKPIYDLTKNGRNFIWGEVQQKAFEVIKAGLQKPPVLSMQDKRGRFILYSDTSKHATGNALYQVQDGSPRLIAYTSKECQRQQRLLCNRARNVWFGNKYSNLCSLVKRVDFDTVVDHLARAHIMKSKGEPATNRIKRLLEILSSYSFNLYYIKGKDMVLSDFCQVNIEIIVIHMK